MFKGARAEKLRVGWASFSYEGGGGSPLFAPRVIWYFANDHAPPPFEKERPPEHIGALGVLA